MNLARQNDFPLHSASGSWTGATVANYLVPCNQIQNQQVDGHRVAFNTGEPLSVRWKERNAWQHKIYSTGAMGIVPHGEYNTIMWDKDLHATIITLEPGYAEKIFELDNIQINQHRGLYDKNAFELITMLKNESQHEHFSGKIFGESLVVAFAIHLITNYADFPRPLFAPKGKLSAKQLKNVIEYCNEIEHHTISLGGMAEEACLSMFHFVRMFKRSIGITPHQFILQRKIERAVQLLKQQKMPLNEIAYTLGFTDYAHFSNAFKRYTGFSPKKITAD